MIHFIYVLQCFFQFRVSHKGFLHWGERKPPYAKIQLPFNDPIVSAEHVIIQMKAILRDLDVAKKPPIVFFGMTPLGPPHPHHGTVELYEQHLAFIDAFHRYFHGHFEKLAKKKIYFFQVAKIGSVFKDEGFFNEFDRPDKKYYRVLNALMASAVRGVCTSSILKRFSPEDGMLSEPKPSK